MVKRPGRTAVAAVVGTNDPSDPGDEATSDPVDEAGAFGDDFPQDFVS